MFAALVLICAGAFKSPDMCYMQVHDELFSSHAECKAVIYESLKANPEIFTWYDEELNAQWKPVDFECMNWNRLQT